MMSKKTISLIYTSSGFLLSLLFILGSLSTYGAEPIDGFRELKFGMTPQDVQTLNNCSTANECLYELSSKNRYAHISYRSKPETPEQPTTTSGLAKISIDMGQFSEGWYNQLQMILGNSYRLTHDFTDERQNAFLAKEFDELQAGYEDGQIVLTVSRRRFGNLVLKLDYQDKTHAAEFVLQQATLTSTTP